LYLLALSSDRIRLYTPTIADDVLSTAIERLIGFLDAISLYYLKNPLQ